MPSSHQLMRYLLLGAREGFVGTPWTVSIRKGTSRTKELTSSKIPSAEESEDLTVASVAGAKSERKQ
jgi:hypothetical protein